MSEDLSLRSLLRDTALTPSEAQILMAHVLEKHSQLPRSALLSRDDMSLPEKAMASWKDLEAEDFKGSLLPT